MTARALQKLIHVGCRKLGIDGETRRDLQLVVTGKSSMSDMTEDDLNRVIDALKDRGFRPSAGSKPRRPQAKRADVRYAHVLWRLLHQAGVVSEAGPAGLNAFIRRRFARAWGAVPMDVDALTDHQQINTVLRALQDMCDRNGVACRRDPRGG